MKNQMAYLLIIAGLISIVSGVFILTKKEERVVLTVPPQRFIIDTNAIISSASENEINIIQSKSDSLIKPIVIEKNNQIIGVENDKTVDSEKVSDPAIENKKKGDAFERYIVKRFEKKYFRIKEWRSDKYVDGIYAESNRDPDLEISFNWKGQDDLFAVECKWRKDFFKGELEWAENYQLDQYQKFSKTRNLPVFIIIGVGGSPADPKYVYIIPLGEVKSNILKIADIKQYLKTDNLGFYWDREGKTLS